MAATISWQFIAWPLSVRTRAAESRALSFLGCSSAAGDFASFAAAAFLVEVFVFFLPAMMRLLRKVMESRRRPTRRPNRQDSYLVFSIFQLEFCFFWLVSWYVARRVNSYLDRLSRFKRIPSKISNFCQGR